MGTRLEKAMGSGAGVVLLAVMLPLVYGTFYMVARDRGELGRSTQTSYTIAEALTEADDWSPPTRVNIQSRQRDLWGDFLEGFFWPLIRGEESLGLREGPEIALLRRRMIRSAAERSLTARLTWLTFITHGPSR